jgi:general secretion pathway protein D
VVGFFLGGFWGGCGGGGVGGGGFGGGLGGGLGGGGFGGGRGSSTGSTGSPGSATISGGAGGGTGKEITNFESQVSVTADAATNSLVISAAPQDYQTLRGIIQQLDVPRRQVFVQAVIVEISTNHERDLGINFESGTNLSGSTLGAGALNFGQLQNALSNPLGLTGLSLGLTSNSKCSVPVSATTTGTTTTTTSSTVSVPCDVALLTALASDTHSNILSAPTLLTADNEEASIVVGQNLPFIASAQASGALVNNIFNSVDRQNVGITLDIVPQVTEGDYVRMDLYEEVSAVVGGTQNSSLGPTTSIRSASTTVMVQDHRTTVIGGLLSDDTSLSGQGIPFLSSIPVLGHLFSNTSRTAQKTNLIVFLTPHVIRSRQDLRTLSLDERQKFIKSIGKKEQHDMPISQLRQLYKPSFSVAVPPGAELESPSNGPPPEGGAPSLEVPPVTPLNTEEINPPSAKRDESGPPHAASGSVKAPEHAAIEAPSRVSVSATPAKGAGPTSSASSSAARVAWYGPYSTGLDTAHAASPRKASAHPAENPIGRSSAVPNTRKIETADSDSGSPDDAAAENPADTGDNSADDSASGNSADDNASDASPENTEGDQPGSGAAPNTDPAGAVAEPR